MRARIKNSFKDQHKESQDQEGDSQGPMISQKMLIGAMRAHPMRTSEMRIASQTKTQVRKRRPKKMASQVCHIGIKVDRTTITLIFKGTQMKRLKWPKELKGVMVLETSLSLKNPSQEGSRVEED